MSGWLGDRHWQMLVERMDRAYSESSRQLVEGFADDYPEYRYRAGYLACIRDIKDWSREIIDSMDARPAHVRNTA